MRVIGRTAYLRDGGDGTFVHATMPLYVYAKLDPSHRAVTRGSGIAGVFLE